MTLETKLGKRVMWPNTYDRPREAALVLTLERGTQVVFSTTLLDVPNSFSVTTELPDVGMPLTEVLRVGS